MTIDRSTLPLEMLGEPDDTECPHGIPTGMGVECWECRYEQLNQDHVALEDDYAALEQRCRELEDLQYVYNNTPFAHWVERCKELEAENATDVGRLTSDLRYIQGIVERGTGKPVDKKLPITGQILEYVKSLEREKQELAEKVMELETIASVRETSSQKKVIFLRKRLEPIERVWKTGEDYMLYDAVKECMEMKEGG